MSGIRPPSTNRGRQVLHKSSGPSSSDASGSRSAARLRCAVYTRKSTEDGLEQEFNSLDAQREACAAYIASQIGLGWKLVPDRYDDGGISGGTIERPGLQRLLQDIRDRKVDVVVVYKIDRLTRSLADFAKIVEVFDAHGVSFVSVTQQFNTTTSMGRLTLNVLLSFAQFEREVTAERIRDKIAASKKKGMWMGGTVPLGYRVADRKLLTKEPEASFVRELFSGYLEVKSVPMLAAQVSRAAAESSQKEWNSGSSAAMATDVHCDDKTLPMKDGCARSHKRPISSGMLYKLLANPLYIGKLRHKGNVYDGEHAALIDVALFEAVQQQLAIGAAVPKGSSSHTDTHLLTGILFDDTGDRMAPTHARTRGQRYRYYISGRIRRSPEAVSDSWRIPAAEIEGVVVGHMTDILRDRALIASWAQEHASADLMKTTLQRADDLSASLANQQTSDQRRSTLHELLRSVTLMPSAVRFQVNTADLVRRLVDGGSSTDGGRLRAERDEETSTYASETTTIDVPISLKRRGVGMRIVVESPCRPTGQPDASLIQLIARAHIYFEKLTSSSDMTSGGVASAFGVDRADVGRILPLAFLSPEMLEAMLKGRQSSSLTPRRLARIELPISWADQQASLQ